MTHLLLLPSTKTGSAATARNHNYGTCADLDVVDLEAGSCARPVTLDPVPVTLESPAWSRTSASRSTVTLDPSRVDMEDEREPENDEDAKHYYSAERDEDSADEDDDIEQAPEQSSLKIRTGPLGRRPQNMANGLRGGYGLEEGSWDDDSTGEVIGKLFLMFVVVVIIYAIVMYAIDKWSPRYSP